MKLRKLEEKDARFMLEWMHDHVVVKYLQANYQEKTIEDCIAFVHNAQMFGKNIHLAIVDDSDEYMGTVSLKNIENQSAEFAIVVRKCASGKGYAKYALQEIMRIGFEIMKLKCIYWYAERENIKAINFYERNGYMSVLPEKMKVNSGKKINSQYVYFREEKSV